MLALLLVAVSPVVPRSSSYQELNAVHFGLPFWFASSDMSVPAATPEEAPPGTYPERETFNPWENPTSLNPLRFVSSWVVVFLAGAAAIWFAGRINRRRTENERRAAVDSS